MIFFISRVRKQRPKEVKSLAQGYTANKRQGQNSNRDRPESDTPYSKMEVKDRKWAGLQSDEPGAAGG